LEGENPKLPLVKTGHVFFFDRKELKTKWEGMGLNLSPAMLYKQATHPLQCPGGDIMYVSRGVATHSPFSPYSPPRRLC